MTFYERETWAMKTMARFQGNGQRPLIDPEPCDHPLYADYSEGITLDRAWQLVHLHSGPSGASFGDTGP